MNLELDGKVVLVTGGSDGLGRALCRSLVDEGVRVAFCGREADRLSATSEWLREAGGDVIAVPADVSRLADIERFVGAAVEAWDRIDGVVNNAGQRAGGRVEDIDDETWAFDLHLKLYASARLCRLTLPYLRRQGGSIVNVLATSAKEQAAGSAPSSVSRAAGMALTKALSKEVAPEGIRVNAVLIGVMESGQWERVAAQRGVDVADVYQQMASDWKIPIGRVGKPQEFADLVSFLLSPRSGFVTGTAVNLDGGMCAVV